MHIVVIDDEKILSSSLERKLTQEHYWVTVMNSYDEYLSQKEDNADMYIVDLSLWDGSWINVIKSIRSNTKTQNIPILIISWHSNLDSKVEWLDSWADDYLVKPFEPDELLARVRSLLRRKDKLLNQTSITYKKYVYDFNQRKVFLEWRNIPLTKKERQILEILLSRQDTLIEKDEMVEKFWTEKKNKVTDNTINVTFCNLRKKLWDDFNLETRIWQWYILKN